MNGNNKKRKKKRKKVNKAIDKYVSQYRYTLLKLTPLWHPVGIKLLDVDEARSPGVHF